jgi:hypothetical protein
MSFKNQLNEKKDPLDDVQRLMCSVPGCPKRWSVDMGKPMCSEHQWSDKKPATKRDIGTLMPSTKPVKHWMDDGDVF